MKKIAFVLILFFLLIACSNTCVEDKCMGRDYTVSEPVEVIYKNTTYRTVYEPKTYRSVSYVRKPYKSNCLENKVCR